VRTGERILQSLELGAATVEQLAAMLSVNRFTIYSAMTKLEKECAVRVIKAASPRRSGRPQNIYSLPMAGAVPLGRMTKERTPILARLVGDILFEHGEVALFVGADLNAEVAICSEPSYAKDLSRQIATLVGVYRTDRAEAFDPRRVVADIGVHLRDMGVPADAA